MDSPIIPSFPNEPVSIDNSKTISFVLSVSPSEKLKGASTLGSDINEQERRYRTVKAITLHWHGEKFDSDPYGPAREAAELLAALSKWGWQTEDYYIMADDPAEKTAKFLTDCTRASQSDELLVVYYVGHGRESSKEPTPQPFGVARQGSSPSDDASIDWPVIRSVLEAAQCDVVMFLNCCHGADAWVSRNLEEDGFKGPPGKVMSILSATTENQRAYMYENMSFGTLLKRVLDDVRPRLGLNKSISIPMLTKAMKDEIKRSKNFRVLDVVHGSWRPMDPCLYEHVDGEYRNIRLHRTLGERGISETVPLVVVIYEPLLGPAGQYWQREMQETII